jgi:hypothetical protein
LQRTKYRIASLARFLNRSLYARSFRNDKVASLLGTADAKGAIAEEPLGDRIVARKKKALD